MVGGLAHARRLALDPLSAVFLIPMLLVPGAAYPALTPDGPAAHRFERDLAVHWGIRPVRHPWL